MQLSIIIPMYNAGATIARTLASLRDQDCHDFEALVIDDGSTDNGPSIVSALAKTDPRIRLISQKNAGVCAARNHGLDLASGDFILFLDSDDWMLPHGIDLLLKTALRSGTGAAVGKFNMVSSRGETLSVEGPWSDQIAHNHLLGGIFMTIHGHIVERRFYQPINGLPALRFDPALKLIEDTDLWLKLAERGVIWQNSHSGVCAYLMRSDSRSVDFAAMLHYAITVYQNAYARAAASRAAGTLAHDIDISPARLDVVLGNAAVGYATRLAISRPGAVVQAQSLLNSSPGLKRYEPVRLARLARHAVMFALGDRPDMATTASHVSAPAPWWDALRQWWAILHHSGCIAGGGLSDCLAHFAQMSNLDAQAAA